MYRYTQIDENGYVVSDSYLSGEVTADNMILISEGFDLSNKKYVDGSWKNTHQSLQQKFLQRNKRLCTRIRAMLK